MHIYAFGSVCRGEITPESDVDLLGIVSGPDPRFNPDVFSVYSYSRLEELWKEGNPFAWHLALESRLLFSSDGSDYIRLLKDPQPYTDSIRDCGKFYSLFREACTSLSHNASTAIFDLSVIFLSIRNIATCYSLGCTSTPDFSRDSALHLAYNSVPIPQEAYNILRQARVLCTRGYGASLTHRDILRATEHLSPVEFWMTELVRKAREHARV